MFWGAASVGVFSLTYYVSIIINGTTYWTPVYLHNKTTTTCSTNLVGTTETTGTFTAAGYVAILENNTTDKWLPIYTRT